MLESIPKYAITETCCSTGKAYYNRNHSTFPVNTASVLKFIVLKFKKYYDHIFFSIKFIINFKFQNYKTKVLQHCFYLSQFRYEYNYVLYEC